MKKRLLFICAFLIVLTLTGCKSNEKTFTGSGVTVTLNDTFYEKEVLQAPLYLESTDHFFMAVRESKTDLSPYGINSLDSYIKAVLKNGNKNATIETFEEDDMIFKYAYYTSRVQEKDFGYMIVTLEGDDHFYTINFGCLEKNLEDNKEQYMKWAKTILVD